MARPKSETATIKDIACAAHVSPSTVSRVLNNPGYEVSEALRSRVRLIAEQLEYQKAGRLRDSRIRGHLGVILPNVINPMYAQALTGIETIALDYDCGVTVNLSLRDRDREFDYLSELFHRKILSVILSPVSAQVEGLKTFIERGMRVVLLDQRLPGIDCDAAGGGELSSFPLEASQKQPRTSPPGTRPSGGGPKRNRRWGPSGGIGPSGGGLPSGRGYSMRSARSRMPSAWMTPCSRIQMSPDSRTWSPRQSKGTREEPGVRSS